MGKHIPADFGIYAFSTFKRLSAMQYYRLLVPLKAMYDRGIANIYADDGDGSRQMAHHIMSGSDIALAWNHTGVGAMETVESFANLKPIMAEGAMHVPPAFVFDMDDAIEYTHPLNSSYGYWGTRGWDGNILNPGDKLLVPTLIEGKTKVLWEDKVSAAQNDEVWDIERNIDRLEQHYKIANRARGVTVSTPFLASLYREHGAENVYVFPNSVIEEDYFFANLAPHEGVRIFWQGGSSHFEDWAPIRDALVTVLKEFPNAKFVSWGELFPFLKDIPPDQLEVHGWDDYAAYKVKRPLMDADINLCPLVDSPFNKAKSAIKWYEASLGPRPELTIAAAHGPYQEEIEHGVTGLLYRTPEEFAEQLRAAIKDAELRKTIASRSQMWVRANRAASKTVVGLYEFFQDIKRRQRIEALTA